MKKKSIVIIAIVALACIAAIIAVIWKNAPAQKQAKQLELGNRYLEEMNYEQAKVVFEELISIAPSNTEAYLGAAKAYAGLEDYEGAVAILQKGYDQTGSEDIKAQMEEYEQKLEEQKAEAEQALESEISEYMATLPCWYYGNKSILTYQRYIPVYTYSYLKRVYAEKLPKLFEYMEMDISDMTRWHIWGILNDCYLHISDMDKAKEAWTQFVVFANELGVEIVGGEYDEYGRPVSWSDESGTSSLEYYENSSSVKVYTHTSSSSPGYVWRTEYEYDEEGRTLKAVTHLSGPGPYTESEIVSEITYTYEANSCKELCKTETSIVEYISIYDDRGLMISYETYDETGNLTSRIEYDTEGNVISDTSY